MTAEYDQRAIELLKEKNLIEPEGDGYAFSRNFRYMYSATTMGTSLSEIEESQRMPYFKTTVKETIGQIKGLSEEQKELIPTGGRV